MVKKILSFMLSFSLFICILSAQSSQAASFSANAGQTATFTVTASGTTPFTYQWFKDGTAIVGATSSSLVISPIRKAAGGNYTVSVANSAGSATSSAATLTVTAIAPVVTTQPVAVAVSTGQTVNLTVVASGFENSYIWYATIAGNTSDVQVGTGATFSLSNAQKSNSGQYYCKITNEGGTVTSNKAIVSVTDPIIAPSNVVINGAIQ